MLSRRQQWRRAPPRVRSRSLVEACEIEAEGRSGDRHASASAPEMPSELLRAEPDLLRRSSAPALGEEQAANSLPFPNRLFPNRRRRRVTWQGTIAVRCIPRHTEMQQDQRQATWWSHEDLTSFAVAELERVLAEQNLRAGLSKYDEAVAPQVATPIAPSDVGSEPEKVAVPTADARSMPVPVCVNVQ